MNRKTTYEITITNKLEQLPLPDLADEIWQRIETQLDIELPGDNSQGGSAPKGGGSFPFGWGAMIFLTVLATYLFIRKSNDVNNPLPSLPVTPTTTTPQRTGLPPKEQDQGNIPSSQQGPVKAEKPNTFVLHDSMNELPAQTVQAILPDTSAISTPVILPQQGPLKEQVTKKPKGVTNISDSDYKVIPKKDSSD